MVGTDRELEVWAKRIDALEVALDRLGRPDLQDTLDAIRGLFVATAAGRLPRASAVGLLGRGVADLKARVVDPTRPADAEMHTELARAGAIPRRTSPPPPLPRVAPSSRSSAITPASARAIAAIGAAPVESDSDVDLAWGDGWAEAAMSDLAAGDDHEVAALLSAMTVPQPKAANLGRPRDELGTLREPLVAANGKSTSLENPDARVLMKGELQPGLLSDIIQLFAQNSETGRLYIEGGDKAASIYLIDGTIVNAVCGDLEAERGFFEAMNIHKGRFSYQRGVKTPDIRIFRTAQHLIMETLRLIDEQS